MSTITEIHSGQYSASYQENTPEGALLVITKPSGGGRYMQGEMAEEWANAIQTAIDKSEANALCRAIINS